MYSDRPVLAPGSGHGGKDLPLMLYRAQAIMEFEMIFNVFSSGYPSAKPTEPHVPNITPEVRICNSIS